jgi:hypothetical protein
MPRCGTFQCWRTVSGLSPPMAALRGRRYAGLSRASFRRRSVWRVTFRAAAVEWTTDRGRIRGRCWPGWGSVGPTLGSSRPSVTSNSGRPRPISARIGDNSLFISSLFNVQIHLIIHLSTILLILNLPFLLLSFPYLIYNPTCFSNSSISQSHLTFLTPTHNFPSLQSPILFTYSKIHYSSLLTLQNHS